MYSSLYEGTPLLYYVPKTYQPFNYLNRFDYEDYKVSYIEEARYDSNQSDSENSVSSLDGTPKTQEKPTSNQVQCNWKSCGVRFETLNQLATHVSKVHSSSGPGGLFYCGWEGCTRNNKGFNARYKMLVHVRTHTNEKPHKCFLCEKSFSRAENLKIHSRSHSGEKPYVCPVPGCNKAYSNSSDRFKHTRTHQVEKPYQCKVPGCPKKYTDPSSLRKHVKTYKHFVNENVTTVTSEKLEDTKNCCVEKIEEDTCTCTHRCCLKNGTELLKLKAFINLSENKWNELLQDDSYTIYKNMEDRMDVDVPLDLSITRN